jgi:signal transduction histidine kinase
MQELLRDFNQPKPEGAALMKIYADGKESFFEKEIVPINTIPTGEAEPVHIGDVIILRNVTVYKELDAAKTNFIATLSHEFKTPISAIRMGVDLLRKQGVGPLNEQQHELLNGIDDDASRLLRITSEILNLSQVETGHLDLTLKPEPPALLMKQAIDTVAANVQQRDIKLLTRFDERLPEVLADADKVIWVLSNLLGNAIRYSYEHSTIQVSITALPGLVRFDVLDHGKGIAAEYIPRIFEKYFRIPGSSKEGTGLGLAISKELIEAMGGRIDVKSELGAGSLFSVELKTAGPHQ